MGKTGQRQRLVRVSHRVVFGTVEAVQPGLAAGGWQINTAFVERLNMQGSDFPIGVVQAVNP